MIGGGGGVSPFDLLSEDLQLLDQDSGLDRVQTAVQADAHVQVFGVVIEDAVLEVHGHSLAVHADGVHQLGQFVVIGQHRPAVAEHCVDGPADPPIESGRATVTGKRRRQGERQSRSDECDHEIASCNRRGHVSILPDSAVTPSSQPVQRQDNDVATQWEYKVVTYKLGWKGFKYDEIENDLNELGVAGHDVVVTG